MYKGKKITVIIPVYNEEMFISQVIKDMPSFVDSIIVVDDASEDSTSAMVKETGDPRVIFLRNKDNGGVGYSMVKGYRKALELNNDIVVKADGDGQTPLDYLAELLNALIENEYDYAKGNRFLEEGSLRDMPKSRLIGNIALTFFTKLSSGYWHVFDPQNGFTAIKASCLGNINLDRVHKRYFFENDMLIQLNIHNFRVKDIAMPAKYGKEESGVSIVSTLFTFPWLFLRRLSYRIYQKYILRDFSAIALFLVFGILLVAWGTGFGLYHWVQSIVTGIQRSTGTVMLAVLPFILGFQLLLQAIVLDMQEIKR